MNFHGKVRVAYMAINSILIMLGYFVISGEDKSLMTDQDLVMHGVSVYLWPLALLFMTGLLVAVAYALRGLWLVGKWCYRQVA